MFALEDGRHTVPNLKPYWNLFPISKYKGLTYNPDCNINDGTGSFEPAFMLFQYFYDPVDQEKLLLLDISSSYENLLVCPSMFLMVFTVMNMRPH